MKAHGIEPAPERKRQTSWSTFLKTHWDCLASIDFTTIEVWIKDGLVTYYLLFVMEVATRRVQLAGCTVNPTAVWMTQIGRNLTDPFDGFLRNSCYLVMDRDTKHCQGVSRPVGASQRQASSPAASVSESDPAHRAIHANHQGGVPGTDDHLRGAAVAKGHP